MKLSEQAQDLERRIDDRSATVGIIGMGYVGLPLALLFAEKGFRTTGFDIDPAKTEALLAGRTYIRHIPESAIRTQVDGGRLLATTDFADLAEMDAIVVCVPTPLAANREPELGFVVATAESIREHLRPGQLIVIESTTYPGTCDEIVRPILEKSGLELGRDVFLAYSPEREDPGNTTFSTGTIPKIVGGNDANSAAVALRLYGAAIDQIVPVSTMATAEAVKITENVFRAVNIALVNELKTIYDALGIDIWEVIKGASTKPFGFMPFYPGPGLGGHCIPIDPFYLSWKARQAGMDAQLIDLAGKINTDMPIYVIDKLAAAVETRFGKSLQMARILVIGVAYKKNCDDTRESPALTIIELLEERGASVSYHDPFIPEIPATRKHHALAGRKSEALSSASVPNFDAVLICADHDAVDYDMLAEYAVLIVDTRNAMAGSPHADKVVPA